ncbi:MAG: hypothetical protein QM564_05460 [Bergeyella sp.]
MANWCSNTVVFEGTPETTEQIKWLFQTMAKKQEKENCGQLPDFVNRENGGYFFDLCFDNAETGVFQYQTKWSPNIEIVKEIAEHFKVDFVQDYEELGNLIFGRAIFENNELTDIYLEDEDFDQFQYDDEKDQWIFEGNIYGSDFEILEILLERKIENHFNTIKNQQNEIIR